MLPNGQWPSKNINANITDYSTTSTDWSLWNFDFTEANFGIRLVYEEIDTKLAGICISNTTITISV